MMKCEEYRRLLADWQMGRLDATEKAELERHLNSCADCREALAAMQPVLDSLSGLEDPEPSAYMKVNFRAMLDDFKAVEEKPAVSNGFRRGFKGFWASQPHFPMAYGLMVLLICVGATYWFSLNSKQDEEIRELHGQVQELKQTMMLAMLDNPLASERIKAVSYTSEIKRVDRRVVDALLATLNDDPNVNVRLSTLEALAQLGGDPEVRTGLIQSISTQDSPLIQLAIADVMLKLQEKRSVNPFKELLKQKGLDDEVRHKVEETIAKLM
jgi:hypothetical protein